MLILISPAKTLDFEKKAHTRYFSQPEYLEYSEELVEKLKSLSPKELSDLMNLSSNLAELNYERYQKFNTPFKEENAKQALLAFKGDVYEGMQVEELGEEDLKFAQKHLRIISGLYGLLKPMDLIQPYRLEMGTKLKVDKNHKNLYEFWGDKIARGVNNALKEQGDKVLLNLASNEYFKAVKKKKLEADIYTPVFKDFKKGKYKVIAFYAKKARGMMSKFVIRNKIEEVEDIKGFDEGGYSYNDRLSKGKELVFTRD